MPLIRKHTLKKPLPAKSVANSEGPVPPIVDDINGLVSTWQQRLGLWPKPRLNQTFSIASDCSGYGSELLALRLLGLQKKAEAVMTCECCEKKRALHHVMADSCGFDLTNCRLYVDISARDNNQAPRADLYCAGWPCPSYSKLGKRKGVSDARGMVILHGLSYVASRRPRTLVLEQVSAILEKKHRRVWQFIQKTLRGLKYEFTYEILNTRHFGIPQSRPRLYLVAVCQESLAQPLCMPKPREHHPDLHTFLDKSLVGSEKLELPNYEAKLGAKLWKEGWVLDVGASVQFQHPIRNCAPCLIKTRCKQGGYYVPKLNRRLSAVEVGRFQGLPTQVATAMVEASKGFPPRTFEASAGDAMSINVLQSVLRRALESAGLTAFKPHTDYWKLCPADRCWQLSDSLFQKFT